MSISIDTVIIDSQNEILDLKSGLFISDFSENKRYLYNFNSINHSIEKIDLDNLEFVDRYYFEKEGPNGVGEQVGQIQYLQQEMFYLTNGIFNLDGQKISDLNFNHVELSGDTLTFQQPLNYAFLLEKSPNRILGAFPSLETIDLNKLELISIQSFDKEGPNGVGNKGRGGIVHLGDDRILFKGWPSPDIFTTRGEKLPDLGNLYGIKTNLTEDGKDFLYEAVDPEEPQLVFGIINEFPGKTFEYGRIDVSDSTLKTYPLPTWKNLDEFTITYDDGKTYDILGPYIYVANVNHNIIVSSNISSELYVYKPNSDSLHHFTYSYKLTKSEKTGSYPTEISDPKEFHNIFKSIYGDVSFLPPIWDPDQQQYYRIHYETLFEDDVSGMYPKGIGAKVYITVYDKDFQLKAEGQLPEFQESPRFHFAKDGKIWIFQNIDDEMGFIRFSMQ
ncbi:DUF4221 family protein [Lunatibacter salilacus]|uniref:DUF4221 family protein n=1 Tax=Lunatibacter salilacus TaxID=2483804 RepID=UPI001F240EA2|nr:DUF4221 family protein [Lunatibacter salilacus]